MMYHHSSARTRPDKRVKKAAKPHDVGGGGTKLGKLAPPVTTACRTTAYLLHRNISSAHSGGNGTLVTQDFKADSLLPWSRAVSHTNASSLCISLHCRKEEKEKEKASRDVRVFDLQAHTCDVIRQGGTSFDGDVLPTHDRHQDKDFAILGQYAHLWQTYVC